MLVEKGLVIAQREVSPGCYEMQVRVPAISREARPGQFVHVRPGTTLDPLLRRPLSLYDVDPGTDSITLLYKVVGRGTDLLKRVKPREYVDIMGPLGRGFTLPDPALSTLLVGGGMGVAPLVFLARMLKERGNGVRALYGVGQAAAATVYEGKFAELGVCSRVATMDGSLGFKGTVIELLHDEVDPGQVNMIYSCGPEVMMKAVASYAYRYGIAGEVSLEEYMACGVGACLGCARKLKADDSQYVQVCKDGPVFAISRLDKE